MLAAGLAGLDCSQICALCLHCNTHSSPHSNTGSPRPPPPPPHLPQLSDTSTQTHTLAFMYLVSTGHQSKGSQTQSERSRTRCRILAEGSRRGLSPCPPGSSQPRIPAVMLCSPLPAAAWSQLHWMGFLPGLGDEVWSPSAGGWREARVNALHSQAGTSSNTFFPRSLCG